MTITCFDAGKGLNFFIMLTKLTTTTGKVEGEQHCKDFRRMSIKKFNAVTIINCFASGSNYLQYTLLTNNRIVIYQ